jgi:hypothetical protein
MGMAEAAPAWLGGTTLSESDGIERYEANAAGLVADYERLSFETVHDSLLDEAGAAQARSFAPRQHRRCRRLRRVPQGGDP